MKHLLLSLLLMTTIGVSMAQTTHFVKQNGTGSASSWADAGGDLQATIAGASSGDSIFVAGGIYQRAVGQFFSMKAGVKIYGSFTGTENSLTDRNLASGDTSVLMGNGAGVVRNENNNLDASAVLDGFKITGGNANSSTNGGHGGGGIYNVLGTPTFSNLIITGNKTNYYGGGVENNSASPIFTNVIISGNIASVGGGGISSDNSTSIFTNVLITDNSSYNGGGIFNSGGTIPVFINATITNNKVTRFGGGIYSSSSLILNNSTIWGNNSASGEGNNLAFESFSGGKVSLHHCLFGNGTEDIYDPFNGFVAVDNNLTVSPQFVNASSGNYHLSSGSPAIDNGINDYITADDTLDIARNQRIYNKNDGGIVDIGAYEYQPIHPTDGILYVDSASTTEGDGSSWAKALPSLGDALVAADTIQPTNAVEQIWVAKGTYQPATGQSFAMRPNIKIYGGFIGKETGLGQRNLAAGESSILKGNDASVIRNDRNNLSNTAVLDGFIITGGNATGTSNANYGGGIYNRSVSPTLSHLVITGNTAADVGGGMLNDNSASPTISDVVFSNNTANNRGGGAIGNFSTSNPILTNVTISGNNANGVTGNGGGLLNNTSSPVLNNCIIWGNTANNQGNEVSYTGSSIALNYSLYKNGSNDIVGSGSVANNYSITDDPLFIDATSGNYQLQAASPAINTGNNTALSANDTLDLAGNGRIYDKTANGIVDIGAYEYQGSIALPVTIKGFTGTLENNLARLQWQSGVETSLNHYEIEKSTDGKTFSTLSSIQSQGSDNNYTYKTTQLEPTVYYRLKAVDNDERIALYNKLVTLSLGGTSTSLIAYPNPAKDHINLNITKAGSGRIYDASGRLVKMQDLQQGVNHIDISNLSSGVYFIVVNAAKVQFIKK